MFKKFVDFALFSIRRRAQVLFLSIDIFTMRSCKNCSKDSIFCRVAKNFEKCTKCVRFDRSCDLTSLDIVRWRRLKNRRQLLKKNLKNCTRNNNNCFIKLIIWRRNSERWWKINCRTFSNWSKKNSQCLIFFSISFFWSMFF